MRFDKVSKSVSRCGEKRDSGSGFKDKIQSTGFRVWDFSSGFNGGLVVQNLDSWEQDLHHAFSTFIKLSIYEGLKA